MKRETIKILIVIALVAYANFFIAGSRSPVKIKIHHDDFRVNKELAELRKQWKLFHEDPANAHVKKAYDQAVQKFIAPSERYNNKTSSSNAPASLAPFNRPPATPAAPAKLCAAALACATASPLAKLPAPIPPSTKATAAAAPIATAAAKSGKSASQKRRSRRKILRLRIQQDRQVNPITAKKTPCKAIF